MVRDIVLVFSCMGHLQVNGTCILYSTGQIIWCVIVRSIIFYWMSQYLLFYSLCGPVTGRYYCLLVVWASSIFVQVLWVYIQALCWAVLLV